MNSVTGMTYQIASAPNNTGRRYTSTPHNTIPRASDIDIAFPGCPMDAHSSIVSIQKQPKAAAVIRAYFLVSNIRSLSPAPAMSPARKPSLRSPAFPLFPLPHQPEACASEPAAPYSPVPISEAYQHPSAGSGYS